MNRQTLSRMRSEIQLAETHLAVQLNKLQRITKAIDDNLSYRHQASYLNEGDTGRRLLGVLDSLEDDRESTDKQITAILLDLSIRREKLAAAEGQVSMFPRGQVSLF